MFYLQCYFNLKAFVLTEHLTAWAALMVFVFGTLGFVIPSPGGMGTFHWLCIQALALYGIAGTQAFSYANIAFFTIQIFYNIVGGILALVILPRINRESERLHRHVKIAQRVVERHFFICTLFPLANNERAVDLKLARRKLTRVRAGNYY